MSYETIINKKNKMNGLKLLKLIDKESIKVVFFDPQYRGVLDKLSYGNEGKSRGKERSALPQMTKENILTFINYIEQILQPNGYLFLWVDKFHLFECKEWINNFHSINIVDMITWDKQKIGMGYRSRRRSEYLIIIQKNPKKAKSTWNIHNIPDVWIEKINNKIHTHSKPIELQKQLILATTQEEDIIVDPASGGYSVLKACKETNRKFLGCDLKFGDTHE